MRGRNSRSLVVNGDVVSNAWRRKTAMRDQTHLQIKKLMLENLIARKVWTAVRKEVDMSKPHFEF